MPSLGKCRILTAMIKAALTNDSLAGRRIGLLDPLSGKPFDCDVGNAVGFTGRDNARPVLRCYSLPTTHLTRSFIATAYSCREITYGRPHANEA